MSGYKAPDTGATTGTGLTGTAGTFQHYDGTGNGEYITDENMLGQIGAQASDDLLQALANQTTTANKLQGYSGDDACVLVAYGSTRADDTVPVSDADGDLTTWVSGAASSIFGDGSDVDATISGTTTLTRVMHYRNLTIASSGVLKPAGYHFTVSGTLTIESGGTINDNGNNGSGMTGGAALTARGILQTDSGAGANGRSTLGGGAAGAAPATNCHNNTAVSYQGGTGGSAGGQPGGAGGNPTIRTGTGGSIRILPAAYIGRTINSSGNATNGGGGGGGGAGGCNPGTGTAESGSGGSGGGSVCLSARYFDSAGTVSANGGNGSNAANATGDGVAGGGAGAAGGFVSIVAGVIINQGTITANGGTPGTGVGGGSPGATGNNGFTQILEMAV